MRVVATDNSGASAQARSQLTVRATPIPDPPRNRQNRRAPRNCRRTTPLQSDPPAAARDSQAAGAAPNDAPVAAPAGARSCATTGSRSDPDRHGVSGELVHAAPVEVVINAATRVSSPVMGDDAT